MSRVNIKNTRAIKNIKIWCFYCYFLTYFTLFSNVSIVDFELVNFGWVKTIQKKKTYCEKTLRAGVRGPEMK